MKVEMMNGIMCAVNVDITICDIKTCQHSFMTGDQVKAFRTALLKEYNRKKDIVPKWKKDKTAL
jgi:hypothetical protein